jgi:hypothetical protein
MLALVQNVGLMVFPYLAGKIADAHTTIKTVGAEEVTEVDYTMTMLMFAALGIVALASAIVLKRLAARRTGGVSIEAVFRREE